MKQVSKKEIIKHLPESHISLIRQAEKYMTNVVAVRIGQFEWRKK